MTRVGGGAAKPTVEPHRGKPPGLFCLQMGFPLQNSAFDPQLQYLSLASPGELGGGVSMSILHEQHEHVIPRQAGGFVPNDQTPQGRDHGTVYLVSKGLVCTAEVVPGDFYQ